jgi:hypothetical protein
VLLFKIEVSLRVEFVLIQLYLGGSDMIFADANRSQVAPCDSVEVLNVVDGCVFEQQGLMIEIKQLEQN